MNRRKMLGAAVGGVFAGPGMAKAAIAEGASLLQTIPPPKSPYPYGATAAVPLDDPSYTVRMLAKAKRIASGDIRDEDRDYPTEGNPLPFRALKSISDDARQFMRTRRYEDQWRERMVKSALDTLDNYDKTGIFRRFF